MSEPLPVPEEKSRPATLIVQLVFIPLLVVLFCVGLGALFMWLTSERKGFDDYVRALQSSRGAKQGQQAQFFLNYIQESKRWQGIFDVTAQISADHKAYLAQHPEAVTQLAQVFAESAGEAPKTRRYLALVLGLLSDPAALPALRGGLNDPDPDTAKNCLWALARMGDKESALPAIGLTRHSEASVRLMAVYALGFLDSPQSRPVLITALGDPDEMVQWNAAFALANRGDVAGREVLVRLLDKAYVDKFTEITLSNRQRYRVAAVTWLAKLDPVGSQAELERVSREESDLQVRNAAIQQLNDLRKK